MQRLRTFRWTLACLTLVGLGCELPNSKKFPNPVVGPAPRRNDSTISRAKSADEAADATAEVTADSSSDRVEPAVASDSNLPGASIETASFNKTNGSETAVGGEVAALVNGRPVFVDDVIEALPPELGEALQRLRRQCTPEEFERERRNIARRYLQPIVERELLARGLQESMKPEQFKGLTKAIEREFDEKELPRVMEDMKVSSRSELIVALREHQTNIETLRTSFQNEQMARYFIGSKIPTPQKPDRKQLLAYYQEHIKDFETSAKVRWQHIVLSYEKHGGREKTREFAGELQQQMLDGADFGELARKHSSAPSASEGGTWDWTRKGSLASKEAENLLFTLADGAVGPPIIGENSLELVRVLERKEDYRKPFDLVQDELERKIQFEERKVAIGDYIKKMKEDADIEILINPSNPGPEPRPSR